MLIKKTITYNRPGLSQDILKARKASGEPVEMLADLAGISTGYWYDLEADRILGGVSDVVIRKIEKVLGVDFGIKF